MDSQLYQEYKQILKNKSQLLKIVEKCEKLGYFSHDDLESAGKIIVNDKLNDVYKLEDLKEIDTYPSQHMSPKSMERFLRAKFDEMDYDALMKDKKDKSKVKKNKDDGIAKNDEKQNKMTQEVKVQETYSLNAYKNASPRYKLHNKRLERKQIQYEERDIQIGQELDSFFELQDEIKQQERESLKKREIQLLQEQEQILQQQQEIENLKKDMDFENNQKQLKPSNFIDIFRKYKKDYQQILNKIQLVRNLMELEEQDQSDILNQIEPQPNFSKKRKLMKKSLKITINKDHNKITGEKKNSIEKQASNHQKCLDLQEMSYSFPDSMFQIDEEVQTNKLSQKKKKNIEKSVSEMEIEQEEEDEFDSMFQIDPAVFIYQKHHEDKQILYVQQNDENKNPNMQSSIQTIKNNSIDIESDNIFYKYIVSQQNNIRLVLGEFPI